MSYAECITWTHSRLRQNRTLKCQPPTFACSSDFFFRSLKIALLVSRHRVSDWYAVVSDAQLPHHSICSGNHFEVRRRPRFCGNGVSDFSACEAFGSRSHVWIQQSAATAYYRSSL